MASLIQELENNEALLLMYFTNELPPEDRVEVEQMLANDPGLRANLVQIEAAYKDALGALAILDQDRSAEPAENHAVRQASRAMKQWQVDRLNRQPVIVPTPRTRVPVWAYPIGVAAMLLIGTLIWWGGQADTLPVAGKQASTNGPINTPSISSPLASNVPTLAPGAEDAVKANLLENQFKGEISPAIADAETDANSLIARSDNKAVASEIFFREDNQ